MIIGKGPSREICTGGRGCAPAKYRRLEKIRFREKPSQFVSISWQFVSISEAGGGQVSLTRENSVSSERYVTRTIDLY